MTLRITAMPVPSSSVVDVWQARCSEPYAAGVPADRPVRTRAFAAVPTGALSGGEVCPVSGVLGGTRPAGSPKPLPIHVDVDPSRPRPSGGPS